MTAQELKSMVCAEIDRRTADIVALSQEVLEHPETGYRETATAARMADRFTAMELSYQDGLALTGVKARMSGRSSRRTVAVLGELDSLIVPDHPHADPATGAAHACGHNAQLASMYGAGLGLKTVIDQLDGDVVLFAVPAEECIEIDYRLDRRDNGDIEFLLGKAELLARGAFDDIDLALITHTSQRPEKPHVSVAGGANGSLVKRVRFQGIAAHAGATPWQGVNALKAATLAIAGIDAQRDTFRDVDAVRVSQILTSGGVAVSAVPADARMELMIRANNVEAMADASAKVDRALRGAAMTLGAEVHIRTFGAYLPLHADTPLAELTYRNCAALLGPGAVEIDGGPTGGSTDMGDLGRVMPVVHPMASTGNSASLHGRAYYVTDHVAAAVQPAKFMAMTVVDLLVNGAAEAQRVIAESGPKLSRDEYLSLRRGLDSEEVWPAPH